MPNKQLFTESDIYAYKLALSRHAAKNNRLIEKWTKVLEITKQDIDELYTCKPSDERTWRIRAKESVLVDIQIFLDDLRKPCDSFISGFEWQNAGKESF